MSDLLDDDLKDFFSETDDSKPENNSDDISPDLMKTTIIQPEDGDFLEESTDLSDLLDSGEERPVPNTSDGHKSDYIPESDMLDWLPPRADGKEPHKTKLPEIKEEEFELKDSAVIDKQEDFLLDNDLSLNEEDLSGIGESNTEDNEYIDKEKLKSIVPDGSKKKVTQSQVFREHFGVEIGEKKNKDNEEKLDEEDSTKDIGISSTSEVEDETDKEKKIKKSFFKDLSKKFQISFTKITSKIKRNKIKRKKPKKIIRKKRKIGFLKKSWTILFSLLSILILSYMTPTFMQKEPTLWYLPLIFISVFFIFMLFAIKKGWHETALSLILFSTLTIPILLLIHPFNLESAKKLILNSNFISYFYILSSFYLLWAVATNNGFKKIVRLFLLFIGSYGFIGFIASIKNKMSINTLLSYSPMGFLPGHYANSFFVFLNIFLPLLLISYIFYSLYLLFKLKITSFISSLCVILIALMLFASGNLSYHYNHFLTPITKFMPGFKEIIPSDLFKTEKIDEKGLSAFASSLKSLMTKEVTLRKNSLRVASDNITKSKGTSLFFPRSSRIISLIENKLYVSSSKKIKKALLDKKISCFGVSPSGNFLVYVLKNNNNIMLQEFGKNTVTKVGSSKNIIDELTISEDGKTIIARSSEDVYVYSSLKRSKFKRFGKDYIFSPIDENKIYYSAYDENYGNYSIWQNSIENKHSQLLVFDNNDKFFPSPSPDNKFIAYLSEGNIPEIWLCDINGNNKKLLYKDKKSKGKINAISWNYDGSKILVSSDDSNIILDLNILKEYTVAGKYDERLASLKKKIKSLGVDINKISLKHGLTIIATLTQNLDINTLTKIMLSAYTYIPEDRTKELKLIFKGYGTLWETDIPLSSIPFFNDTSLNEWIQKIKWRKS